SSRRFRCCRSSLDADGSRSLSTCLLASSRAFELASWLRPLAGVLASACSTSWRIASERVAQPWSAAHASTRAVNSLGSRRPTMGVPRVAGGPRLSKIAPLRDLIHCCSSHVRRSRRSVLQRTAGPYIWHQREVPAHNLNVG